MGNRVFALLLFLFGFVTWAQERDETLWIRTSDTVRIPIKETPFLRLQTPDGQLIDTAAYRLDWRTRLLVWNVPKPLDSIQIIYRPLPAFLTKTYAAVEEEQLLTNAEGRALVQMQQKENRPKVAPFAGLDTKGSITRGITVGNNQNAVTNSSLDLQITGDIAPQVKIRASLQDANLPIQDGGYSQKLDEFDQIFIELYSDNWKLRAGDLLLTNRQSRFVNFDKKVQGLSAHFQWDKADQHTEIFGAGAVVRGQYAKTELPGVEGNQGPYRLRGTNGALYIMVVSGSERVYVNGRLLTRGENNDYTIDYNAGEITFTSLFPINSEQRIVVEYQYSERYFTRLLAYGGFEHRQKTWHLGAVVYSENDIKNQPLQQSLTDEQIAILAAAGDDTQLMMAPSAQETAYTANQILYAKRLLNGQTYYEFSTNADEVLYQVRFSFAGANQGDYRLSTQLALGRVYEYVPPINGIPQGEYVPDVQLIAPTSLQVASVRGGYQPSEKTAVAVELGVSRSDKNLFSTLDDTDNVGGGLHVQAAQQLAKSENSTWQAKAEFFAVQAEFQPIERLYSIEFDRDWNITQANVSQRSDQLYGQLRVNGLSSRWGTVEYGLDWLDYAGWMQGNRHHLNAQGSLGRWDWYQRGNATTTTSASEESTFWREEAKVRYSVGRMWVGAAFGHENNQIRQLTNQQLEGRSQRYTQYQAFIGRGDSTAVFVESGVIYRTNDSIRAAQLVRVNNSWNYYVKSRLIQTTRTQLQASVNYRQLRYDWDDKAVDHSLNSRVQFATRFADQWVSVQTAYENVSGQLAQQEYAFVEVDPGLGVYTWIDYNSNGLQELEEFEIAAFVDQARYVRVFLPNQVYLPTHQNKLAQTFIINPIAWKGKTGWRGFIGKLYSQTAFSNEVKLPRTGNSLDLNPFVRASGDVLAMAQSFRTTLYYNRGIQRHSVTYTYTDNQTANTLNYGKIAQTQSQHQLQYAHKFPSSWLIQSLVSVGTQQALSEQYAAKNYRLEGFQWQPKFGYLWAQNSSWDVYYNWQEKRNTQLGGERLRQHQMGTQFQLNHWKKFTCNGALAYIFNDFKGQEQSAVGYTMMEGLTAGKNWTWRLLLQHNLTEYLEVNVNYSGRKSAESVMVHTGSIQLRAFF